jgi:F-type H+-transporting ATPase subunit epsilon
MATIHLRIVTPEGSIFDGEVDEVLLPGVTGEEGILPVHAAMMTEIQAGELRYRQGTKTEFLAIGEGFAEVDQEHIYLLTDGAANVDQIDEAKVQEAIDRAQAALADTTLAKDEFEAAQAALARSVAQLNVKRKRGRR